MGTQYHCTNPRRLLELRRPENAPLNGIDYLEVLDRDAVALASPRQQLLIVQCVRPVAGAFSAANVRIDGGVRIAPVGVLWAARASEAAALAAEGRVTEDLRDWLLARDTPEAVLVVRTDGWGDFPAYRLRLVDGDAALAGFDPPLSEIAFSFKAECPTEFDCLPDDVCPPESPDLPPIDYLAKDYHGFRKLMLDRLSVTVPGWRERNPAGLGVALVEVMAYAADHLSYYQDAVAAEAYLGTARRRTSLRRHARLLDYAMHEGCNARAWVAITAADGVSDTLLPRRAPGGPTRFLTRMPGQPVSLAEQDLEPLHERFAPLVFEPLHTIRLNSAHNTIRFHTWGDTACCLPRGATRATLRDDDGAGRLTLRRGDVLIFEEVLGPRTGAAPDADPARRHAVRLTRVTPEAEADADGARTPAAAALDDLFGVAVVEIAWDAEDALPFPLCLSSEIGAGAEAMAVPVISVARGNVVLADHGRSRRPRTLAAPTGDRSYRPALPDPDITWRVPFDADAWEAARPADRRWRTARAARVQEPGAALPAVTLLDTDGRDWQPKRDLLASDRFDAHFVVETAEDRTARLRFGDGTYGMIPAGIDVAEGETPPDASYRTGGGSAGNVGADAIAHIVATPGLGVDALRNPLPAIGGTSPEALEEVRQYAPHAFRRQDRAVTEADYAEMAERHPEVVRAVARRLWTGSWHTIFVAIDRAGGRPVDAVFERELAAWLDRFRLAGHDVEIEPPVFVPLDIALQVCVDRRYRRSDVKEALLALFGRHDLGDGRRGYFHPDNFTFGQPVLLGEIVARAMGVAGVRWVTVDPERDPPGRFRRWGEAPRGEIAAGRIALGGREIARLDNDPNARENGRLEFVMEGGL